MTKYDIAILGGDRRTACMAPIFVEKGYRVICFRTVPVSCAPSIKSKISFTDSLREALDAAPVLIGGIPFAKSDCLYCASTSIRRYLQASSRKRSAEPAKSGKSAVMTLCATSPSPCSMPSPPQRALSWRHCCTKPPTSIRAIL